MALTKEDLEVIADLVTRIISERNPPVGLDCIVSGGSWDSTDGTAQAIIGDTDAANALAQQFGEANAQLVPPTLTPVATTQYGDQYGPVGNERVVLIPTQSGLVTMFTHGPDDSPGAPSGEQWRCHRNAAGEIDAFFKHTNDGSTPGDGLGGAHMGGNAALSQLTTKDGWVLKFNDTGKLGTLTSPLGHTVTVDDNPATSGVKVETADGLVSHLDDVLGQINQIAPQVGIGLNFGNMDNDLAAARNTDLATLSESIKTMVGEALQQSAQAAIAAGVPNAGPWLAAIQSGLPTFSFTNLASTIAQLIAPACSTSVRINS